MVFIARKMPQLQRAHIGSLSAGRTDMPYWVFGRIYIAGFFMEHFIHLYNDPIFGGVIIY